MVSAAVNLSKLGNSRAQYVSNKFLYAAFGLDNGSDGVDKFAKLAGGDVGRMARELASKVVGKLKDVYLEDDL
jgi:hypothetical protein